MEAIKGPSEPQDNYPSQRILGIPFFDGTAVAAVEYISAHGGYAVVPAAPALVKLSHDAEFRRAITSADLALPDSGLMVVLWRLLGRPAIRRLSGLGYLKAVIELPELRTAGHAFWIVPTQSSQSKALMWARRAGFSCSEADLYIAPVYGQNVEDEKLLATLERQKPRHIIIAIGGGPQEKLGLYLRDRLSYRPAIHCIGAALGFLTGDQVAIPDWADRFYLGWLLRLFAQPRVFVPRLFRALRLPFLMVKYGENLPRLSGEK